MGSEMCIRDRSKGWRTLVAHREAALARRARTMSSIAHVLNRELSAGWTAWRALIEARAASMAMLRAAGSRMANRSLAAAWGSLVALLEEKARLAEPMRKGLSRMLNRSLALGFTCWQEHYFLQRSMRSGLRHLLHRGLSKGWRTLVAHREAALARRARTMSSIAHVLNRELSAGCLLYTSPSPRDGLLSRMPSSA